MREKSKTTMVRRTSKTPRLCRIVGFAVWGAISVLSFSCMENEISFFVEHVKTQPQSPACAITESDDVASRGLLDVIFRNGYTNGYLVQNQLMAREDYDNLKAENNGIFVDSFEVSVRTAETNEEVGASERIPNELYIEPESSTIILADVLPQQIVEQIAEDQGCLPLTLENYPADTVFSDKTDRNGRKIPRQLDTVNTRIQFFGHSPGKARIQTQVFTFPIQLCCGCLIRWENCMDECSRYCSEQDDLEASKMCIEGVANGENYFDCRALYLDKSQTWPCLAENPDRVTDDDPIWIDSTCSCPCE